MSIQVLPLQNKPVVESEKGIINCRGMKWGDPELTSYIHTSIVLSPVNLTHLNLADNEIGDSGATQIANLLLVNMTVESLTLNCNKIGLAGITAISQSLRRNKGSNLSTLYLCDNNLGPDCGVPIARLVEETTKISHLNLYNNKLMDRGVKKIADALTRNSSITYISLSSNRLTDAGAKYISEALKINKSVEKLYLHNNNFTDEGARSIHSMLVHSLTEDNSGTHNGGSGSSVKKHTSRLKVVNLTGNRITRMLSVLKNDFGNRISMLYLDQQKQPLELDSNILKPTTNTTTTTTDLENTNNTNTDSNSAKSNDKEDNNNNKSPRSKKKYLRKKPSSYDLPIIPTESIVSGQNSNSISGCSNESKSNVNNTDVVDENEGSHIQRSKAKTRLPRRGPVENDDPSTVLTPPLSARPQGTKKKNEVFAELSNIPSISETNSTDQVEKKILQANYAIVSLRSELEKKKLQITNSKRLLESKKSLMEGLSVSGLNLDLINKIQSSKKKLVEVEKRKVDAELELLDFRRELEDLKQALMMSNGLIQGFNGVLEGSLDIN